MKYLQLLLIVLSLGFAVQGTVLAADKAPSGDQGSAKTGGDSAPTDDAEPECD